MFTPAPDHAAHVQLCMEHGKHVISACPACMTLEEAAVLGAPGAIRARPVKKNSLRPIKNNETRCFAAPPKLLQQD